MPKKNPVIPWHIFKHDTCLTLNRRGWYTFGPAIFERHKEAANWAWLNHYNDSDAADFLNWLNAWMPVKKYQEKSPITLASNYQEWKEGQ